MNESLAYGCTETEMDGIRIRGPTRWKRYSTRQGGDAITFLREFCGMRFSEAVDYLLHGRSRDSPGRNGESKPQIIGKYSRNADGMEEKILGLYACGMSQRDISEQIKSQYDMDISPELVSKISERRSFRKSQRGRTGL